MGLQKNCQCRSYGLTIRLYFSYEFTENCWNSVIFSNTHSFLIEKRKFVKAIRFLTWISDKDHVCWFENWEPCTNWLFVFMWSSIQFAVTGWWIRAFSCYCCLMSFWAKLMTCSHLLARKYKQYVIVEICFSSLSFTLLWNRQLCF